MKRTLLALLFGLLPLGLAAQTNLLTNASFENGTVGDIDLSANTTAITGWTYYNRSNSGGTFSFSNTSGEGTTAFGTYFVATGASSADAGNGLYQNFTATLGQEYTASIYIRSWGAGESTAATFAVYDNANSSIIQSSTVNSFVHSASYVTDSADWTQYSFTFTATSTDLQFRFYDNTLSGSAGSTDLQFDNASVVSAVPEPSTYAAFAGLAALGLAVRRRRQLRAAA